MGLGAQGDINFQRERQRRGQREENTERDRDRDSQTYRTREATREGEEMKRVDKEGPRHWG